MARFSSIAIVLPLLVCGSVVGQELTLALRFQQETSADSGRFHRLTRRETWKTSETAIIVCDVWDSHHSWNAVRRVEELAPRLNKMLHAARRQGVTIIHAPSDCMGAYAEHPARLRAVETPRADPLPDDIRSWCSKIPAEERGVYPLDQSDGGDDDDREEHASWVARLKAMGRNTGTPWLRQTPLIEIDAERDYITDRGEEVWSILQQRGINRVMLAGVHTNMCVLGRPFGLRQMARNGKNVVLVRDLTDTMYNPARWPFVSHFSGTDLIISHIEKYVCPTVTSDQILGDAPFRFAGDKRPHLVIVMAEDEYQTNRTLPEFAVSQLGRDFRVSLVYGSDQQRNDIPGLDVIRQADVLMVSIRRRTLPPEQLELFRQHVRAGKPVVGIRTASHAFALRNAAVPDGFADWPEFDREVFGGNYTNHHGNRRRATVSVVADAAEHPVLQGVTREPFPQGGSLYKTSPLAEGCVELVRGTVEGERPEPVAWTFTRRDGGRSFYTALGHVDDFRHPECLKLLRNGVYWAAQLPTPAPQTTAARARPYRDHWALMPVPGDWTSGSGGRLQSIEQPAWYRCAVRLPATWVTAQGVRIDLPPADAAGTATATLWWNGKPVTSSNHRQFSVSRDDVELDDANLLVVRLDGAAGGWTAAPAVQSGGRRFELRGRWQFRVGDQASWSGIPLPARYGASADVVFEP